MAWLLGLTLAVLILLLLFLILPVEEWKQLFLRFKEGSSQRRRLRQPRSRRRPAPPRQRRRSPPPRTWEAQNPAPVEAQPPVHERVRQRMRRRLEPPDEEATPPSPRAHPRRLSMGELRIPLIIVILLGGGLLGSLLLEQRITPHRPHRLTIALTHLSSDAAMLPWREGYRASEELLASLEGAFQEAGLDETIQLRIIEDTPADAAAAYDLARRNDADLLLWGWSQGEESPQYYLQLALVPRMDEEVPEFEEYLQLMMTPPDFPLVKPGAAQGLSPADLSDTLAWLAHFYLGEFEQIEDRSPEAMQRPALSTDVFYFHWAALQWLKGSYKQALDSYDDLIGQKVPPACLEESLSPLCLAASNNKAVVMITQEALGDRPPTWLDQAITILERVAEEEPGSLTVHYNLGRAYLARGKLGEAITSLEKVINQEDRHGPALAALSEAYGRQGGEGNLRKASTMAQRAISADRRLADGQLALGRVRLVGGDVKGASRALGQARELAESEGKRRRSREAALREGARPNLARAAYTAAWARRNDPTLAQVHLAQADIFLLLGREEGKPSFFVFLWRTLTGEPGPLDDALAEVKEALSKHSGWIEAFLLQGEIYLVKGAPEEAVKSFEEANGQDLRDPRPYLGLARAYRAQWQALLRAGKEEEAQEKLELARSKYRLLVEDLIAPGQGYFGLGQLAQETGDWAAAQDAYLKAVEVAPDYAEAYLRLGQVELKLGNEETALIYLDEAAQKAGGSNWIRVQARVERGEIFIEKYLESKALSVTQPDLLNRARQEFQAALDDDKDALRALNGLGRVAYEGRKNQEALGYFQQALNLDQNNFDTLYGLGRVNEALEQSRVALEYLKSAVAVNPGSIAAHYHLGVAYYAQLQEGNARQEFERVQSLCEASPDQGELNADDKESCNQYAQWLEKLSGSP